MHCSDISELAPLYVAGELDSTRAAEFDAHLKTCPVCMRELEAQARLDARLREVLLAEHVDVSGVNRRIREMIAADTSGGLVPKPQLRSGSWVTAVMGVAAALLVLAAGYLLIPVHVARVYADAAFDHRLEVVEHGPRPWLTDSAKIAALAQQQGISDPVPLVLASGYHLERAKICLLDGRLFLHAVYSDGTREFSLYLRPRDGEPMTGTIRGVADLRLLRVCDAGGEHLSSFQTSRLTALVATDQSAGTAVHLARAVSAAL
jgi:anti-sigma factor RsiW